MTQAQWLTEDGLIQGRWGIVPGNSTHDPAALNAIEQRSWVLDLDMFSSGSLPFGCQELISLTEAFSKRIYAVFRDITTEEFLKHYGASL